MASLVAAAAPASLGAGQAGETPQHILLSVLLVATAVGVVVFELCRSSTAVADDGRAEEARARSSGLLAPLSARGLGPGLRHLLPEATGLLLCLALAGALLLRGTHRGAPVGPEDQAIWSEIQAEWPLLMTADSLLGLQAMLRALLLASAVCRAKEALGSSLAGEPALLLFLAAAARVLLLALSPQDVYHLDGPLGGAMHVGLELAALGPLAFLAMGRSMGRGLSLAAAAAAALLAAWAAATNRLAIADPKDAHLDVLFSFSELLELAAAAAFLARAARAAAGGGERGPFAAFAHALLPPQQLLSAYFLLTAWGGQPLEEMPALVGAGRPFMVLQLGAVAQVGLYTLAAVAHFALGDEPEKDCGLHLTV